MSDDHRSNRFPQFLLAIVKALATPPPPPRADMPELEPLILQRPQLQQRVQRARLRNLEALQRDGIDRRGHTHARVAETQQHTAGAECVRDGLNEREGESESGVGEARLIMDG